MNPNSIEMGEDTQNAAKSLAEIVETKRKELKVIASVICPDSRNIKSGRFWKRQRVKICSDGAKKRWNQSKMNREEVLHVQAVHADLKVAVKQRKELRAQRRKDNEERRKANEQKAEICQLVTKPHKMKRIKRKQIRNLVKRDPDKVGAVPIVYDSD